VNDFIVCYRLSMADYVEDGQGWDEIVALATEVEAAGATLINTGIGWHEARVPTIVTSVPNSAFVDISNVVAEHVRIPVVAPNGSTCRRPPSRSWPGATGVVPRIPDIPAIEHPMVLSYAEAISGKPFGKTAAAVGAGGIGFDVSEFLVTTPVDPADDYTSPSINLNGWKAEWGAQLRKRYAAR
jgi:NADPH-dependent 2,4-dienoyl-CoA reductase/sulfur reductase-like enzyme